MLFLQPKTCKHTRKQFRPLFYLFIFASGFGLVSYNSVLTASANSGGYVPFCSNTATVLKYACNKDVSDDFLEGIAICMNISDRADRRECYRENHGEKAENVMACREVFQARKELCGELGEARYDPPFGEDYADNFVDPLEIGNGVVPNAYLPLIPGTEWVYEATVIDDDGEEVTETVTVVVTEKTKLIQGITCVVVNDVVEEDGEEVEDTDDWFAQDLQGNVWYCGEIAENFESFEGDDPEIAELVDIDGSWKSGRDGAKAGILIPAMPQVGVVIRQEVAWSEAEDVIEILSVTGTESTPAASCNMTCLVTRDFTPLEPGNEENKYYAPGVGPFLEINLETGERLELIKFTKP